VVVGNAGYSGSGKTTLAIELVRTLGGIHFPLDSYLSRTRGLARSFPV
jgi:uridine kinase